MFCRGQVDSIAKVLEAQSSHMFLGCCDMCARHHAYPYPNHQQMTATKD